MFCPVEGFKTTYKLGDFSAAGMQDWGDSIQFLDPDTASTYVQAVYLDAETYGEELAGWWKNDSAFVDDADRLDSQEFDYGTSFLAAFTSGETVTIKYAGAVIKEGKTFTYSQQSVFFGNYLPKDLTLADISATGMQDWGDSIQILDPDTASTAVQAVYLDAETYGKELAGWWKNDSAFVDDADRLDNQPVPAGQGFLAAFTSGEVISVSFPAAY